MNNQYDVALYSEDMEPVVRFSCSNIEKARCYIAGQLKLATGRAFTATLWGPHTFICFYRNSLGEIFENTSPVIFSRAESENLRRKPIPEPTPATPHKERRRTGERRKEDRRK